MENKNKEIVPSSPKNTDEFSQLDCECEFYEVWDKNLKKSQIPSCLKRKVDLFFQDTVESGLSRLEMRWNIKNTNAVFLYALRRSLSLLHRLESQQQLEVKPNV